MKFSLASLSLATILALSAAVVLPSQALAHGKVNCGGGPKEGWKPVEELKTKITAEGWKVRKAKPHRDCYEVYGVTPEGDKVEAFFHPVTLERVLVLRRGEVLYKAP